MAANFMDSAKEMRDNLQQLFGRLETVRTDTSTLLDAARVAEDALIERQTQQERERQERERAERLQQLLSSDGDLAVHVGGKDEPHVEEPAPAPQPVVESHVDVEAPPAESEPAPAAETQPAPAPAPAKPEGSGYVASRIPEAAYPRGTDRQQTGTQPRYGDRQQTGTQPRYGDRQQTGTQPRYGDRQQTGTQPRYGDRQQTATQPRTGTMRTDRPGQGTAAARPGQPRPGMPPRTGQRPDGTPLPPATENRGAFEQKKTYDKDKKTKSKKTILKETAPQAKAWDDDTPMGNRRTSAKRKQQMPMPKPVPVVIDHAIITTETITVKDLSEKLGKPATEIIKKLFLLGVMATINQEIDYDTCELIASEFRITLEQQLSKTFEDVLADTADDTDKPETLVTRPPVVTIMGHVDHGKTSLLDAFRNSTIAAGEAGGITQHIGAYTVLCKGRQITFIDTPGHEAFTAMRARGAQVTDIVILVVAADDGIMPQTVEAINHAKAANVPIIVAINKIDRENADPERVKKQLTEYGLVTEEWGGDTICVPVSAKKLINLDQLLEMVLLQADVLELKANPNRLAKGTIIEAKLDKARGPVATVLVQNGTLKKGDTIVAGTAYGRIRAMMDDKGRVVSAAGPAMPVEVLGFNEVPSAGDVINAVDADKLSRQVAEERKDKIKAAQVKSMQKVSLDDLFSQMAEGDLKDLNIIVKADVQGSVEAVKQALEKLSNDEVRVRCIHGGVGAITGSDIMFASASNAIVIGFNVRPDASARQMAEREKVDVRTYRIIYNAIEDVQNAMKGMFKPVFHEVELGRISVRSTFKVSGVGTIAGAYVQEGKVSRNAQVRVVRDGIVIHDGKIASLKRFKDDAKEVLTGYECGISIENFNDIQEGDTIEAYMVEEVQR